MYSRHYRYNPLFTNPTVTDVKDPLTISFFDSIVKARAFLNQVSCLPPRQLNDEQMQNKIESAKKMVAKADRRNDRRKARRATKAGRAYTPPVRAPKAAKGTYNVRTCDEAQVSVENLCDEVICAPAVTASSGDLVNWEEVLGPDGSLVRFKLEYGKSNADKNKLQNRKRVRIDGPDKPQNGDIILDLTTGIKAWKITGKGRSSIPVTKKMESYYKTSSLYKVRQLAAGNLSPAEFLRAIEQYVKGTTAAKRSLRKKRKK